MTFWVDEIKEGDEVLLCYCSLVLNRLVRLVPRELVAHALISCLRKVSYCSELSVLRSRRVVFMSRLARPCLEKHNTFEMGFLQKILYFARKE